MENQAFPIWMRESTHQELQLPGRQLRTDGAIDEETEPNGMPFVTQNHITVFQARIDVDTLPFNQPSQFFFAYLHPGPCGVLTIKLNQPGCRLDKIPDLIKGPHSQRGDLQPACRRQGNGPF